MLYGRRFLQVKRHNQQHQSTEGEESQSQIAGRLIDSAAVSSTQPAAANNVKLTITKCTSPDKTYSEE